MSKRPVEQLSGRETLSSLSPRTLRGPSIAERIDAELAVLRREEAGINTFDHKRYELLLNSLTGFKQWFLRRRGYWLGN